MHGKMRASFFHVFFAGAVGLNETLAILQA